MQMKYAIPQDLVNAAVKPMRTVGAQVSWGVRFDTMEDANGLTGANPFLAALCKEVSKVCHGCGHCSGGQCNH